MKIIEIRKIKKSIKLGVKLGIIYANCIGYL